MKTGYVSEREHGLLAEECNELRLKLARFERWLSDIGKAIPGDLEHAGPNMANMVREMARERSRLRAIERSAQDLLAAWDLAPVSWVEESALEASFYDHLSRLRDLCSLAKADHWWPPLERWVDLRRAATNVIWFARNRARESTVENVYLDNLETALASLDTPHVSPDRSGETE